MFCYCTAGLMTGVHVCLISYGTNDLDLDEPSKGKVGHQWRAIGLRGYSLSK